MFISMSVCVGKLMFFIYGLHFSNLVEERLPTTCIHQVVTLYT